MDTLISDFPQHIDQALSIASTLDLEDPLIPIQQIVICGMGGSGIGGELVAMWIQDEIRVPILCYHDYTVPNFINQHSLVIASSYSGNTEETLAFVEQAKNQQAQIIGISSGGMLHRFCIDNGFKIISIPFGFPPRTALAFSMIQSAGILVQLNLISETIMRSFHLSKLLLETYRPTICDEAKRLADFIADGIPVFYAITAYQAALVRARQQMNENAKIICLTNVIPEMNHNELVGWGGENNMFRAVFFDTGDLSEQNKKRMEVSRAIIEEKTTVLQISIQGNNLVERTLYFVHLVDWASFYLSEIKQVDPIEVRVIDRLKSELSSLTKR